MTICIFLCPQPHGQLNSFAVSLWTALPTKPSPTRYFRRLSLQRTCRTLPGGAPSLLTMAQDLPQLPRANRPALLCKHTTQVPKYTPALSDDDLHTYSLFPLCLWKTPRQRSGSSPNGLEEMGCSDRWGGDQEKDSSQHRCCYSHREKWHLCPWRKVRRGWLPMGNGNTSLKRG